MSYRTLQYILGAVVAAVGVAMVPAAIVAGIYQEWADMGELFAAAAMTFRPVSVAPVKPIFRTLEFSIIS